MSKRNGKRARTSARTTKRLSAIDIVRKLEHDPDALDLVVKLIEKLAERSPIPRRNVQSN